MESFTGSSFTKVHIPRLDRGEYLLENRVTLRTGFNYGEILWTEKKFLK
ncbi:MAG: hypothetical protein FWF68_04705 [Spirochaetes bacterium]|nr:hypothetical protein [Spirochaetota bacterium]